MEDQKQLLQLLIKETYVYPFDPKKETLPPDGETFSSRIRTKWYKVKISLHQLPGVDLQNRTFLISSENRLFGSPRRGKIGTLVEVWIIIRVAMSGLAIYFSSMTYSEDRDNSSLIVDGV